MICCSHTHFAPASESHAVIVSRRGLELSMCPGVQKILDFLLQHMVEAAVEALGNLRDASAEYVTIPLLGIAFSRCTNNKSDNKAATNYMYPENDVECHFQPRMKKYRYGVFVKAKRPLPFWLVPAVIRSPAVLWGTNTYPVIILPFSPLCTHGLFACLGFFVLGNLTCNFHTDCSHV